MRIRRLLVVGLAWTLASTLAVQPAGAPAAVAQTPALVVGQEFDTGAAGNNDPWGIWSDGITLWVVDGLDDEIYAYDTATKERKPSEDFDEDRLAADNDDLEGIWSDGDTMWATDDNSHKIFAYDLNTKDRVPGEDFETLEAAGNVRPGGIWSDGTTMWVTDLNGDKIFAYDLKSKARKAEEDFDALEAAGNRHSGDIWSDGDTMWVADWGDGKVYAYDRGSKERVPRLDFVAEGVDEPLGLWGDSDLGILLVTDLESDTVRAVVLPESPDAPTLAVEGGDGQLTVTWPAGADPGSSDVVGYEVRHRRRNGPDQAWNTDDTTVDVAGRTATITGLVNHTLYDVEVRAVNSEVRSEWSEPAEGAPTDAAPAAGAPGAPTILAAEFLSGQLTVSWSAPSDRGSGPITGYEVRYRAAGDSPSMDWVELDVGPSDLSATIGSVTILVPYDVQVRARNDDGPGHWETTSGGGAITINTGAAGNNAPWGIWSDGATLWVVDGSDDKIYAYDLVTKARKAEQDFDEDDLDADNDDLEGIWSNGVTMWVSDHRDNKIYAYNLDTKNRVPGEDFETLGGAGNHHAGNISSDGVTMWVVDWIDDEIYAYNLTSKARERSKDFDEDDLDADNRGPTGIWSDGTTMWVSDWNGNKIYAYDLNTKERVPRLDFGADFVAEGDDHVQGLWGDPLLGIILVADQDSDTVRAVVLPESPDAPTGVAVEGGDGRLTVTWTAGDGGGSSAVVGYEVRHRRRNGPDQAWNTDDTTVDVAGRTATIMGLVNHTLYDVQVRAVNSEARSEWAAAQGAPTDAVPAPGAPGVPTDLAAVRHSSLLNVTWTAPSDPGASSLTGYEVRYRAAGGPSSTEWVTVAMDALTPAAFITGPVAILTPYDVQVRALNDAGGGHWATTAAGGAINLDDDNDRVRGIWSDGETMWVVNARRRQDRSTEKIFAYNAATGERDPGEDFDTLVAAGNDDPRDIWSDGETMWVSDRRDDRIYAYDLATKARRPGEDFEIDTLYGEHPSGIWSDREPMSDGGTMWVVDDYLDRVLAYDMDTKRRKPSEEPGKKPSEEFDVPRFYNAAGIWSDGITVWISSFGSRKVQAHNLETKERDRSLDFSVPGTGMDVGWMWSDGDTVWIVDGGRLNSVALPSRPGRPENLTVTGGDSQLALSWQAAPGRGIVRYEVQWRDDAPNSGWTTVIRSDPSDPDALAETVSLDNGIYYEVRVRAVNDARFTGAWALAGGTPAPDGAPEQPDGLVVSGASEDGDEGGEDRAFVVEWDEETGVDEYEVRYRELDPDGGSWAATTVNGASARIAGLAEGRRYQVQVRAVVADEAGPWATAGNRAGRGFYSLDPDNSDPRGIWSDGTTMWVSDWENPKIFAYDMATKERVPLEDFDTLEISGNDLAAGLWGDSSTNTMWVGHTGEVRGRPGRVFAYRLDTTEHYDAGFSVAGFDADGDPLTGSGVNVLRSAGNNAAHGVCSDGQTLWVSDRFDVKVYAYDISRGERDSSEDFDELVDPDAPEDFDRSQSRPTGMWCDRDTMWIADADTNRVYAYDMDTKQRDRLRDIPAHDGLRSSGRLDLDFGSDPYGLWSDGETLWVLDDDEDRIVPVVLPDPPGAPTVVQPVDWGDSSATVSWQAGTDEGSSPVESYELRYRARDTNGEWTTESPVDADGALTTTITGLTNGTVYDVEVRAVNAETVSEWAEVEAEPRAAPGEPRNLSASPGNRSLLVSWDEPDDDGGREIEGYQVAYREPGSGTDWPNPRRVGRVLQEQIPGLTNGITYEVGVRASNEVGDGDWASTSATPASVPDAPGNVQARRGDRRLTVTWNAPADTGGLALSGYDVQYRQKPADEQPGGSWAGAGRVAASPRVISGLTNGTVYEVRVRARNSEGQSGWSEAAEGTPATTPGLPRNLVASPSDSALVVGWDEPAEDGGDPIDHYEVGYRTAGTQDWTAHSQVDADAPLTVTITPLVNGTRYDVRVRAENGVDEGGWAQTRGTPATVPGRPLDLAVEPDGVGLGGGKLVASWRVPADDGGSAVVDYGVQHRVASPQGSWSTETTVDAGGALTATIEGLDNGASYDVRVRARTVNGYGPFATGSATPTSVPGAPRSLAVGPGEVASGGGKLTVTWQAPADDGGKPIDRYFVRYSSMSVGLVSVVEPTSVMMSVTIEGLTNGATYMVRVQARNANGFGLHATDSATPFTLPDAPSDVEADPGDRTLDVTWEAPADDGGSPVTGHEVRYRLEAAAGSWRSSCPPPQRARGRLLHVGGEPRQPRQREHLCDTGARRQRGRSGSLGPDGRDAGRPARPAVESRRQAGREAERAGGGMVAARRRHCRRDPALRHAVPDQRPPHAVDAGRRRRGLVVDHRGRPRRRTTLRRAGAGRDRRRPWAVEQRLGNPQGAAGPVGGRHDGARGPGPRGVRGGALRARPPRGHGRLRNDGRHRGRRHRLRDGQRHADLRAGRHL